MCAAIAGVRIAFSMPLDLRSNWIFTFSTEKELAKLIADWPMRRSSTTGRANGA